MTLMSRPMNQNRDPPTPGHARDEFPAGVRHILSVGILSRDHHDTLVTACAGARGCYTQGSYVTLISDSTEGTRPLATCYLAHTRVYQCT